MMMRDDRAAGRERFFGEAAPSDGRSGAVDERAYFRPVTSDYRARAVSIDDDHRLWLVLFLFFGLACGLKPCGPASAQGAHFFVAVSYERERRTGACVLARSGAVGDDFARARNLFEVRLDLIEWDFERAFDFFVVGVVVANIDYSDGLLSRDHQYKFVDGDALDLIQFGFVLTRAGR
jgi:hypothetical protein